MTFLFDESIVKEMFNLIIVKRGNCDDDDDDENTDGTHATTEREEQKNVQWFIPPMEIHATIS